jgi:hypothetical protein
MPLIKEHCQVYMKAVTKDIFVSDCIFKEEKEAEGQDHAKTFSEKTNELEIEGQ